LHQHRHRVLNRSTLLLLALLGAGWRSTSRRRSRGRVPPREEKCWDGSWKARGEEKEEEEDEK
jgi:hypothetical protein